MPSKLIDLSMPVHNDMVVFPASSGRRWSMYETWQQFAERIGAAKYRRDMADRELHGRDRRSHRHAHRFAPSPARTGPGPEGIPLDYCYGDGVCLDFRHLPKGAGITVKDVKAALDQDRVHAQAARHRPDSHRRGKDPGTRGVPHRPVGMTGEATHWMLDQGIKMMGIDAITFDPPVWAMFERKQVLGGAPRDVRARVLPPGEHDEPRSAAAATASSWRCFRSNGSTRRPRRCARSRSWTDPTWQPLS